jgi:hypothetical protein
MVTRAKIPPLFHAKVSRARGMDGQEFRHPLYTFQECSIRDRHALPLTLFEDHSSPQKRSPTGESTLSRVVLPSGSRSRS